MGLLCEDIVFKYYCINSWSIRKIVLNDNIAVFVGTEGEREREIGISVIFSL